MNESPLRYWQRQSLQTALFSDLLWSRPQQTANAGKLLIVGGNAMNVALVAESYTQAKRAGIGTCRVLLPDSLKKTIGAVLNAGEYAPSNPSGGFARSALSELIELHTWADGTLFAGDFGRNAETAVLLERFVAEGITQPIIFTEDSVDYFLHSPLPLLKRPEATLVISFEQLQKMVINAHFKTAFTRQLDILHFIEALHEFSNVYSAAIIVKYQSAIIVAHHGHISSTELFGDTPSWQTKIAAYASVWQLQHGSQIFAALTTAVFDSQQ